MELRVKIEDLREPAGSAALPELSVAFVRWGGRHRIGESAPGVLEVEDENPPWGGYGAPPSDWYMDGITKTGLMSHPDLGGGTRSYEVLSLFLGSDADLVAIVSEANHLAALMHGRRAASFWMLWPADFETTWGTDSYLGFVSRRELFAAQRAMEATGRVQSAFPHPADLYEFITSKIWMATLAPQSQTMRLPACVMSSRDAILSNPRMAARAAILQIEELRSANVGTWPEGPALVNRRGLNKGVVKIGWSWEAKFVYFWQGESQLANYLHAMITLPGCSSDFCLVQEWVDFDFELRLFFLPRRDLAAGKPLEPKFHQYTAWENDNGTDAPGRFLKPTHAEALERFGGDEKALASAYEQAVEASGPLIRELLTKHGEAVPFIRMDWMVKRKGPGCAQVVFGEYCEVGADCMKWTEGPPTVWREVLDSALSSETSQRCAAEHAAQKLIDADEALRSSC